MSRRDAGAPRQERGELDPQRLQQADWQDRHGALPDGDGSAPLSSRDPVPGCYCPYALSLLSVALSPWSWVQIPPSPPRTDSSHHPLVVSTDTRGGLSLQAAGRLRAVRRGGEGRRSGPARSEGVGS